MADLALIERELEGAIDNLDRRIPLAQARAEALNAASIAYEGDTPDPSPAEERHLDRMLELAGRAADAVDRLERRRRALDDVRALLEEEREDRAYRRARYRLRSKSRCR